MATEIGSCGDRAQNPPSGASIVLKEDNPSSVSISIKDKAQGVKDKTQTKEQISTTATQAAIPKVVLNINPSQRNSSTFNTVQNNNVIYDPLSRPLVAARSPLPPQTVQPKVEQAAKSSGLSASHPVSEPSPVTTMQPTRQTVIPPTVAPPTANSTPTPATRIAAQPDVPSVIAKPVSLTVNPQVAPAPSPQLAMAPAVHTDKPADSETKKDNSGQSTLAFALSADETQLPQPPALEGAAAQSNSANQSAAANQSDQKIGEAPRDTSLDFLRQQAVLLKPCEWQLDIGFSYLIFDNHSAYITTEGELVEARLRQRLLTMPLEFRYGLYERVQLFANIPFGWANTELSWLGDDDFYNNGGIGDTNVGATLHVYQSDGNSYSPDVLATFGMTAPTGNSNPLLSILETPNITLGQGFWAAYWNVMVVKKYDPVVVFYGFGSRHYFARDVEGFTGVKPGDQYNYQLGTGFAINERITLSTVFFGSYITEARFEDRVLQGTILEPLSLRFATTITRSNNRICEPFVEIGLTDDAPNARAGITWTF